MSLEEYKETFLKEDNKLTASNIETISENHPFLEQLDALLEKEQLPQVLEKKSVNYCCNKGLFTKPVYKKK